MHNMALKLRNWDWEMANLTFWSADIKGWQLGSGIKLVASRQCISFVSKKKLRTDSKYLVSNIANYTRFQLFSNVK